MDLGCLYFIDDAYYQRFSNCNLMENKEAVNGVIHGRPCYYAFKASNSGIYWMVPISSHVEKFEQEKQNAINKYGICDGIAFGYILGEKKAFLVQNMCPVIDKYITNVYVDKNTNKPITIPDKLKSDINARIRKVIRLYRDKGKKIILTNAFYIEDELNKDLNDKNQI